MRDIWFLLGTTFVFMSICALAMASEQEHKEEQKPWSGAVEFGAVYTSGNTDEENAKLRADAVRNTERWRHSIHVDGFRSSQDGQLTARRYYSSYQADRKLNGDALFARVAYEDDRFSGFDYQANLTAGYSRELLKTETMMLKGDAGMGVRHSSFEESGSENELILRLAGAYQWQMSESAAFRQLLSTEIGEDSTVTRSETSLTSDIIGSLAMKLSFLVRHQSQVPIGTKKTDTESSITLVYRF